MIIPVKNTESQKTLIDFALKLIPFLESEYGIKIIKTHSIPGDFDERGNNWIEMETDENDIFVLRWCEDMAGTDWCDLYGIAKYVLFSHPDHLLKAKLYGDTPDPFFSLNIRNDYSCMFWDLDADWVNHC
jgi:hypothetical protein